jgi:hypothetical protein
LQNTYNNGYFILKLLLKGTQFTRLWFLRLRFLIAFDPALRMCLSRPPGESKGGPVAHGGLSTLLRISKSVQIKKAGKVAVPTSACLSACGRRRVCGGHHWKYMFLSGFKYRPALHRSPRFAQCSGQRPSMKHMTSRCKRCVYNSMAYASSYMTRAVAYRQGSAKKG